MTIEPELLMAYADDALDPLMARRVEAAIAADPMLAEDVARHRRLKVRISAAYAPVAEEPAPDRLAALLRSNVVDIADRRPAPSRWSHAPWRSAAAMAACLVIGMLVGRGVDRGPTARRAAATARSGSRPAFAIRVTNIAASSSRPPPTASPVARTIAGRSNGPCRAARPTRKAAMPRPGRRTRR